MAATVTPQSYKLTLLFLSMTLLTMRSASQTVIKPAQNSGVPAAEQFYTFKQFVKAFDKTYVEGSEEYKKREQIYNARIQQLKKMQNDPDIHYTVGVTKFADQTEEEMQKRKPLQVEIDLQKVSSQNTLNLNKLSQSQTAIPTSIDWRQQQAVTSIKDQGDCGACWTFATAAYGQSRLVINKTADIDINLSEQYLLSCTPQCSCDGGYLEYVFEKAAGGVPTQTQYPYSPYLPSNPFICWTGSKVNFGYIPVKYYDLKDDQLKKLLMTGPVAISISATNWEPYKGGVFRCKSFDKVNHAVLLVGYTPSYWIVKNQWGTKWGEQGFIRVTTDPLYNCKIGTSAFVMWGLRLVLMSNLLLLAMLGLLF